MATYTSYLNLKKPEGGERYALADFNANMDKIEAFATRSFTEKPSGSSLIDIIKTFNQGTYNFRLDNASDGPISSGGVVYSVIKTHGTNDTRCAIIALPMDATNNTVYSAFLGTSATSITWHQPWKKEFTAYKSAQDPDNYTTSGFYHIGASTHSPLGDRTAYGILVVYTGGTGHCQQLFISAEAGRIFMRGRNAASDAFSAWEQLALTSQIEYTALTVTKGSGASAISINARKFGRMCVVSGTIDFASAPSSWTNYDIASITNGNTAVTSTIYITALVYGNSGKIATIEINAGTNKLVFRPLGNSNYTDVTGRFFLVYPTD